jgi:hypothetical protein
MAVVVAGTEKVLKLKAELPITTPGIVMIGTAAAFSMSTVCVPGVTVPEKAPAETDNEVLPKLQEPVLRRAPLPVPSCTFEPETAVCPNNGAHRVRVAINPKSRRNFMFTFPGLVGLRK